MRETLVQIVGAHYRRKLARPTNAALRLRRIAHGARLECDSRIAIVAPARFAFFSLLSAHVALIVGDARQTAPFHQIIFVLKAIAAQSAHGQRTLRPHCDGHVRATVWIDVRIALHAKFPIDDLTIASGCAVA